MKRSAFVVIALALLVFPLAAQKPSDTPRSEVQLVEATVDQLQHALRTGLLTSEQLVQMYQARIARYESLVNAYIYLNPNALAEARAIDGERRRGHKTNPMFGIPVLLKDNVDTNDMPTTAGSPSFFSGTFAQAIPPNDAFIAARLREAGAIILGKATLTEFANFMSTNNVSGYSDQGGQGYNPYDPRPDPRTAPPLNDGRPVLTPGGSSSGSGIAVAANLVTVAIGTETSGSILSPGTANMVVGIKPTLGLVSRTGILPITADQDTAGPLARTVADAAALLGVIAGFDLADGATAPCLQPGNCFSDYTQFLDKHALRGARIAVPHVPYLAITATFTADHLKVITDAIDVMRAEGATVVDPYEIPNQADISAFGICISFPPPTNCSSVLMFGQKHDLNDYLTHRPNSPMHTQHDIVVYNTAHPGKYNQGIFLAVDQLNVAPGSADTIRYQQDRQKDLQLTRSGLDAVFNGPDGIAGTDDDFDAILFPRNQGAGAPAKAGYPSITVPGGFAPNVVVPAFPTGFTPEPAPFGVTFSGRAFSEPRLIAIAYAFEQATHHRVPPKSTPPLRSDFVSRQDKD